MAMACAGDEYPPVGCPTADAPSVDACKLEAALRHHVFAAHMSDLCGVLDKFSPRVCAEPFPDQVPLGVKVTYITPGDGGWCVQVRARNTASVSVCATWYIMQMNVPTVAASLVFHRLARCVSNPPPVSE